MLSVAKVVGIGEGIVLGMVICGGGSSGGGGSRWVSIGIFGEVDVEGLDNRRRGVEVDVVVVVV